MIFTDAFIDVLSTFNKINPEMYFREGTVQTTMGVNGGKALTFFSRAYTDVDITTPFAIKELGKLLGVLRMFSSPEINIDSQYLTVSGDGKLVKIKLSNPDHITYNKNPDKIKIEDGYEAVLTPTNINDILGLYSTFNSENISFIGKNGKFSVVVSSVSPTNPSYDEGIIELGDTDGEFSAVIRTTDFRLEKNKKQSNYRLLVNKRGVVFMGNESLEYYIPVDAKLSHFN